MKNKILKIGLTGCGHLGKIHSRLINEISKANTNYMFKGVFDTDSSVTDAISQEYGVKGYSSLEEMLGEIDTLVIVTPTSTHYDIAQKALDMDINIFIEKPVTSSINEAEMLIKGSVGKNVKIQVGHVERFNPALAGSKVKKIDANGVAVISDEIDIANARLTLENGCVANLTSSRISLKKMRKMRIFQNNAYISVDFLNNKSEVFQLTDINTESMGMSFPLSDTKKIIYDEPKPDNPENINPIKNELESFFESIINDTPVKVTLEAGKEAVDVADKIIEIIKKGS